MNNQFLQHLKSITPQGKAEERKIFIPADKFEAKQADKIDMGNEVEELDESSGNRRPRYKTPTATRPPKGKEEWAAYRAKVAKIKADVAKQRAADKAAGLYKPNDPTKPINVDEATQSKYNKIYGRHVVGGQSKLEVARMKRAAAILRRGGADDETIRKGSDPFNVPMSHYNDVNMARYRFFNKAQRSKEDGKKSPRKSVSEATSQGDPNRGRMGRAKPKLPPGLDPYDMYSKGEIQPYRGKLQKRLSTMNPEDRKRYYREIGIRSRAASRGGRTGRLFPIPEGIELDESAYKKGRKLLKRIGRAVRSPRNAGSILGYNK